jgi:hypothetical protein
MHIIQEIYNVGVPNKFPLSIEPSWFLWRASTRATVLSLVLFRIVNSAVSIQFDDFDGHIVSYDFPELIFKIEFHHYLLFIALMISICLNHLFEFSLRLLSSRFPWLSDQGNSAGGIMRVSGYDRVLLIFNLGL